MHRLADDEHSFVREGAWLALRDRLMAELPRAFALLAPWARHAPPNVRRVTARWPKESPTAATQWIVHHALRTLRKANT